MPFKEPMRWEKHLFKPWEDHCKNVNIPLYDDDAWTWAPSIRPFLNRLHVAQLFHYLCGPHGTPPPIFPIVSKPTYNLRGSSIGVCVYNNAKDYNANYTPGHFWMPLFQGEQLSIDVLLHHGQLVWYAAAKAHITGGSFYRFNYWEMLPNEQVPSAIVKKISQFCAQCVPNDYSGALNFEFVGENVIEINGRFSTQFCQWYGDVWFETMCSLYQDGHMNKKIPPHKLGYSFPVWWWIIPQDWQMPRHEMMYDTREDVVNASLQMKRVAIINTETYEEGKTLRDTVYRTLRDNSVVLSYKENV